MTRLTDPAGTAVTVSMVFGTKIMRPTATVMLAGEQWARARAEAAIYAAAAGPYARGLGRSMARTGVIAAQGFGGWRP